MAKRNRGKFNRNKGDFYATPLKAALPLLRHLPARCAFVEPCGGAGDLIQHLKSSGHDCVLSVDPEPRCERVQMGTAETMDHGPAEISITNPPFSRQLIVPILHAALMWKIQSWWLLPSDMLMNQYFNPFARHVVQVVPIGRIIWFDRGNDTHPSTENFCWVKLDPSQRAGFLAPRQDLKGKVQVCDCYPLACHGGHLKEKADQS